LKRPFRNQAGLFRAKTPSNPLRSLFFLAGNSAGAVRRREIIRFGATQRVKQR